MNKTPIPTVLKTMQSTFQSAHQIARTGFGEGTNEHYDRARPSYPSQSLAQIKDLLLPSSTGLNILELGSGTGIFSRLLLSPPPNYPSFKIKSFYAVEPSEGMRAEWTRKAPARAKDEGNEGVGEWVTINGGFTDLSELKQRLRERGEWNAVEEGHPGWADLVVIAQAWHWAHPEYDAAIREIAGIMKPGSPLVFIWNNEDRDPPYPQPLRRLESSLENDTPQQHRLLWEETFSTPAYKEFFQEPNGVRSRVEWKSEHSDEKRIDRVLSKSYVASRSSSEKSDLINQMKKILTEVPEREWIDQSEGTYWQKWWTLVVGMHRK